MTDKIKALSILDNIVNRSEKLDPNTFINNNRNLFDNIFKDIEDGRVDIDFIFNLNISNNTLSLILLYLELNKININTDLTEENYLACNTDDYKFYIDSIKNIPQISESVMNDLLLRNDKLKLEEEIIINNVLNYYYELLKDNSLKYKLKNITNDEFLYFELLLFKEELKKDTGNSFFKNKKIDNKIVIDFINNKIKKESIFNIKRINSFKNAFVFNKVEIENIEKYFSDFLELKEKRKEIKNFILEHNLKLVVKRVLSFHSTEPVKDLIEEGNEELLKSIDLYDINSNMKFTTFAYNNIGYKIMRILERKPGLIHLPASSLKQLKMYTKYMTDYYKKNGVYPSEKEICIKLKINSMQYRDIIYSQTCNEYVSLNMPKYTCESKEVSIMDSIEDPNSNFEDRLLTNIVVKEIRNLLDELKTSYKVVLMLRNGIIPNDTIIYNKNDNTLILTNKKLSLKELMECLNEMSLNNSFNNSNIKEGVINKIGFNTYYIIQNGTTFGLKEIANIFNVTHQSISSWEQSAMNEIKSKRKAKGLFRSLNML